MYGLPTYDNTAKWNLNGHGRSRNVTDFARRFGRHNEDYGTDIRDAGNPDLIGGAASSRNLPFARQKKIITSRCSWGQTLEGCKDEADAHRHFR
jgi:hypothetical protein